MENCKNCRIQQKCNRDSLYWNCDGEYKTTSIIDTFNNTLDKVNTWISKKLGIKQC